MFFFGRKKKEVALKKELEEKPLKKDPKVIDEQKKIQLKQEKEEKYVAEKLSKSSNAYPGKYEIIASDQFLKFRLKASNGEILCVSEGYTTKFNCIKGIETFKKNVQSGIFSVYKDKNDNFMFKLMSNNSNRLLITGESYKSKQQCLSVIESVKKFAFSENIVELNDINLKGNIEIAEKSYEKKPVQKEAAGKYIITKNNKGFFFSLKASNGVLLVNSEVYSNKQSVISAIETFKKAVEEGNFRYTEDKNGQFQFKLYNSNNRLFIAGEKYSSRINCLNAIDSVIKFAERAKLVE